MYIYKGVSLCNIFLWNLDYESLTTGRKLTQVGVAIYLALVFV